MGKKLSEMALEELWQLFPIFLTEHKPYWSDWYTEEVQNLKSILPPAAEYYHIGSTAVNGIMANPIIDVIIAVKNAPQMKEAAAILQKKRIRYYVGKQKPRFAEQRLYRRRLC